jgi:hypothetical protein
MSDSTHPDPQADRQKTFTMSASLGFKSYVCFRGAACGARMTDMVKVFGCRQAYENRPCRNPRGCGVGLWGFRVLLGRGDGETGSALELAGTW